MGEPMIKPKCREYARYVELYNDPSKSPFAKEYFKLGVYTGGESLTPPSAIEAYDRHPRKQVY